MANKYMEKMWANLMSLKAMVTPPQKAKWSEPCPRCRGLNTRVKVIQGRRIIRCDDCKATIGRVKAYTMKVRRKS